MSVCLENSRKFRWFGSYLKSVTTSKSEKVDYFCILWCVRLVMYQELLHNRIKVVLEVLDVRFEKMEGQLPFDGAVQQ
jgi:hypothetical protein